MIAESNDSYRLMLEQVIEKDGHTVMTFKDGNEAMKAYQEATDFDVVFSDWELSGMDGLELTRKIRLLDEIRGKPSYIILTAEHGGNWDVMLAMKTGANDMITKHYTENLITERLKSALVHFTQPPGEIKPLESDPIVHLLEEHKILRFQGKKLEELLDKIDEESSGKLINWLGGRSFVLETKVHQDKENSVSITFLERFIKAQGEGSGYI
ncbi:MAG: response regulator, partial [Candidatus Thermoplasmatota archaeon]|nr:response regulator [Candidatus Thermoplasmatota archaeon]